MHNSTLIASTEHGTDTTQTLKSFKSELDDYVHCWLQSLARSRRRPWSNWLGWSYKRPRNHPFIERISLSPAKSCPHLSCTGRHCTAQRDNLHFSKLSTNLRYFFTSPFPHNWDSQKDCKTKAKICWLWTLKNLTYPQQSQSHIGCGFYRRGNTSSAIKAPTSICQGFTFPKIASKPEGWLSVQVRGRWRNVAEPRSTAPPDYNGWRLLHCRHRPVQGPESVRQQLDTKRAARPNFEQWWPEPGGPGTGGPLGPYRALAAAWWDTVGPPPGPWLVMPEWWWPHWAGPPLWAQVMPSSESAPIPATAFLLLLSTSLAPPIAGQHNPLRPTSENKTRASFYKRLQHSVVS